MPRSRPSSYVPTGFTLGRERFARINAVEGIALTPEMRTTLERFAREGLSPAKRRQGISAR